MSSNVFANGMEVSGKASANKSIAAMPDVCLSPPSPPAGPIPIPYPNTAMASDTSDGSRTVLIGGQEVGLKNQSTYKKSDGNQPATNSFGAGVVSHCITGAAKFSAWSMDVKFEGANGTRFMDMTTHNHQNPTNGGLTSSIAGLAVANPDDVSCEELSEANTAARNDMKGGEHGETIKSVGEGNTTITHGKYTNSNGVTGFVRASSRAVVEKYDNSFSSGMNHDQKKANENAQGKVKSNACGGHVYNRAYFMPHTSHTEARIIEDIFSGNPNAGGTLMLSIDWPGGPAKGLSTKSPCTECEKLICAAKECMTILLCNEDDEPKEPQCPKPMEDE